ncbi:MAG: hypothetical protein EU533_08920 [Promethearchaeota archaeon]|nr:MAG: hypothetical protein EU533_08920 [Candidatus Lokiarchaeota archaeon]
MNEKIIISDFGLIGEDLELKKNVRITVNRNGIITDLIFDPIEYPIDIMSTRSKELILPGLINSHVHIGDSFAKEKGFNKNLKEVVAPPDGIKHKLLEKTPVEIKSIGIKKALEEMIKNGITCFVDFRERGLEGIELLKKILGEILINYLILGRFKDVGELSSIYSEADGIGLVTYHLVDDNVLKELKKNKIKHGKIIACHVAEEKRDGELFHRIVNEDLVDIIIHGTHLNTTDLEQIKRMSIKLVLCPRCNGYFGVGFPPIIDILNNDLEISIGTDNVMANSLDLFEELRYLYNVIRVLNPDFKIEAKSLIKMITINAARNFGLDKNMGSIDQGKMANFFIVDLNDSNLFVPNLENEEIYSLIMQRVNPRNIKKVYIGGNMVSE